MRKTDFIFFKNTPFVDFVNYWHHGSESERDNKLLNGGFFETVSRETTAYNYMRDRFEVRIRTSDWTEFLGVNYCTFITDGDRRYYCWVVRINYINDQSIKVTLLPDVITTFCQGNVIMDIPNLRIERQHLDNYNYRQNILYLRTNEDIVKCNTKKYYWQSFYPFQKIVLFQSLVDLEQPFVDESGKNLLPMPTGGVRDNIVSPVNVYSIEVSRFSELMEKLRDYPWIAQNVNNIMIVPDELLSPEDWEQAHTDGLQYLKLKMGRNTQAKTLGPNLAFNQIMSNLGFDIINDAHLFRSEYVSIEMYSWDGQQLVLDPSQLDENVGIKMDAKGVFGFENEMRVYPQNYASDKNENSVDDEGGTNIVPKGTFLNNSFVFDSFTKLPQLIDNYKLSLASTQNRRELAQSRLVSSRVKQALENKGDVNDKFYNAITLLSNLNPVTLYGKMNDEYEFYRDQKAEFADMSITSPTLTQQNKGNAFQLANENFGISLKLARIDEFEKKKVDTYYKAFGFQCGTGAENLAPIDSMSVANYIQFAGNFTLNGVPVEYVEMMRPLFEKGVRFWHNRNSLKNPFIESLTTNVRIK